MPQILDSTRLTCSMLQLHGMGECPLAVKFPCLTVAAHASWLDLDCETVRFNSGSAQRMEVCTLHQRPDPCHGAEAVQFEDVWRLSSIIVVQWFSRVVPG